MKKDSACLKAKLLATVLFSVCSFTACQSGKTIPDSSRNPSNVGSAETAQHENLAQTEDHGAVPQKEIQSEFKDIVPRIVLLAGPFSGYNTYVDARGRERDTRLTFDMKSLRQEAMENGKIFEPCKIPELPEDHDFNFLVLRSGEIVCGLVEDSWELGVRHINLANEREGLFGGEIKTTKSLIALNVISGSYTRKLIKYSHDPSASILERLVRILNKSDSLKRKIELKKEALPRVKPSITQVQEHCKRQSFNESNTVFCHILK